MDRSESATSTALVCDGWRTLIAGLTPVVSGLPHAPPPPPSSSRTNTVHAPSPLSTPLLGKLLTVSAVTGAVTKTSVLTGTVSPEPGTETFMAGPDVTGLLYTAAPLSYTSYTIFSYDPAAGVVRAVATVPKGELDGIGVCVGFVHRSGLFYIVNEGLVRFDLGTHTVTNVTDFFPAPVAFDPANPGSLIAVTEARPKHRDGSAAVGYPSSALVRVDLETGVKSELYVWNSTFYKRLCHCGLPVRPQDQADIAVSSDGATVSVSNLGLILMLTVSPAFPGATPPPHTSWDSVVSVSLLAAC